MIKVESITNQVIEKNETVYAKVVPLDQAKSIKGLRAVFGEIYPDPVRVISVGIVILFLTLVLCLCLG